MKISKFLMAFTASVLFLGFAASCSDDDDNNNNGNSAKLLISSLEDDEKVYSFSYDSQNRLTKITEKDIEDGTEYYTDYEYDAAGKVIKITVTSTGGDDKTVDLITYSNDSIYVTSEEGGYVSKKLVIDENDRLKRKINGTTMYTDYEYDQSGNVKKSVEYYGDASVTKDFTLDSKKSIFLNVNSPSWLIIAETSFSGLGLVNNVETVVTVGKPTNIESRTVKYNYKYNEQGYPESAEVLVLEEGEESEAIMVSFKYTEAK